MPAQDATTKYYQYAVRPKDRTADGTATLPHEANTIAIMRMADAVNAALQNNIPGARTAAANLLAHIITEGRSDAGVNRYDTNNKQSNKIFEDMQKLGAVYKTSPDNLQSSNDPAMYIAASYDKESAAKRLGKRVAEVWNGTGTSVYGKTGAQHADKFDAMKTVLSSPKNAEIKSLIDRIIATGLTPAETFDVRQADIQSALAANLPDMAYTVTRNAGSRDVQPAAKTAVSQIPYHRLDYSMPYILANIIGAKVGATPVAAPGLTPNQQTELELALTSPRNNLLKGVLP